ncbi:MAG: GNAT family N-acetyltransferase [Jatrophihabitans sp.]|uniref:GNAT family N-acetyltransferase n=1 Tax=Jatrophihabitans sp. TaxID=1932789 RepID=UPI003913CA5E
MPFEIEIRPYDDPDVTRLVAEVQAEYVVMYGGQDAATVDPAEFAPPDGLFLVGLLDGVAVATGGWRRLADAEGQAEIKRMYVVPAARRRGLAERVLAELERTAAEAGLTCLVLNTGPEQPAAVAMYERNSYAPVTPFGHYACHPHALFFGKALPAPQLR